MKSKNRISIPLLILAISACVAPSALSDADAEAEAEAAAAAELGCGHRVGTLHHGPSKLQLTPPIIVMCPDFNFTININPPNLAKGKARTVPKVVDSGEAWLYQTNTTDPNKIIIPVPAGKPDDDYDYEVWVDGIGMLDPRVRVKK
jgi:hypothetical protein